MAKSVIRMIPLNKLVLSPKNVRKTPASEADDAELYASLKAHGLKQNLLVHPVGDMFHVHAGGRRLAFLQRLAKEGLLATDEKIMCKVENPDEAEETSTVENVIRAGMHPADQFEAFAELVAKGRSKEEIANRFGVTVGLVERRLKLARVAPAILEAFRQDEMSLECVMAFTLTDDHARQNEVWQAVSGQYGPSPHTIRRMLTERSYSGASKLARFVSVDAYKAAGGAVLEDLFSDRDNVHLENPDLLERLALEKLEGIAVELRQTWKWAEAHLEAEYDAFRAFGRVYPLPLDPDPELVKELEELQARAEVLENDYDEDSWTEELQVEEDQILSRIEEIERLQSENVAFTAEQQAVAGAIVTVDYQGTLRVEAGLVRPEDIPARAESETDEGGSGGPEINMPSATRRSIVSADPAEAARKEQGVSLSLAEDLRATRHQILKAHLAADYATAFDVMLYSMCQRVLRNGYGTPPVAVALTAAETYRSKEVLKDTVAARMLDATRQGLILGWMDLTQPSDFEAMSALSDADKQALFAWCSAYAVNQQLATDSSANPVIELIGRRMEIDVAACWRPTAETYWSRVNKGHAIAVARELIGDRWADDKAKEKKAVIAADMEFAFSEDPKAAAGLAPDTAARTATWLPDGMVFSGDICLSSVDKPYTMIDEDSEEGAGGGDAFTEADAEGSEGAPEEEDADEIPAFLRQAAE